MSKFKTVKTITEGLYKEKGSKFLSFAIPCANTTDAKNHIDSFWKKHPNAVHVCYAWRFGYNNFEDKYSDDGEPSGTAGRPIFGQILSFDLTNVLIVVVRYYGGVNLGTGGLIQAYKTAAQDALNKAEIIETEPVSEVEISFTFEHTGIMMRLIDKYNCTITNTVHNETGTKLLFKIPTSKIEQFTTEANSILKIYD